jgi:hypothetical protein
MKLPVLCPQEYEGATTMRVVVCDRCVGWDRVARRCAIDTGAEDLPLEALVPDCPIQDRCQHQIQSDGPCLIRARGMICESALVFAGVPNAERHPLAFNASLL